MDPSKKSKTSVYLDKLNERLKPYVMKLPFKRLDEQFSEFTRVFNSTKYTFIRRGPIRCDYGTNPESRVHAIPITEIFHVDTKGAVKSFELAHLFIERCSFDGDHVEFSVYRAKYILMMMSRTILDHKEKLLDRVLQFQGLEGIIPANKLPDDVERIIDVGIRNWIDGAITTGTEKTESLKKLRADFYSNLI